MDVLVVVTDGNYSIIIYEVVARQKASGRCVKLKEVFSKSSIHTGSPGLLLDYIYELTGSDGRFFTCSDDNSIFFIDFGQRGLNEDNGMQ